MSFFRRSSSRPQRQQSDPIYDQQPAVPEHPSLHPSKFGPHFQKGQQQEQIYLRRAEGENIPPGHPDLHGRAHTFHPPRQIHEFTDPYVKNPNRYSKQMEAERAHYKSLALRKDRETEEAIRRATKVKIGYNNTPHEEHGLVIETALARTSSRLIQANK
ncbi:uncharacterized protein PGRI_031210 [Penicillium griseofulvum]|uniref:Uncharacterized protein n=1 Tax=Penicillium patulum TaxID=5078 RepID=A0A135LJU2_PENPA|nr:uncharacterized protein PGRI_031210 [Penicillium griseofulvum]KXG49251.1 hypothetical protein PGRI_031210 [Penicillium griseofulvum]